MVPTRELAKQVSDEFESISDGLSVACFYGGTPYEKQSKQLAFYFTEKAKNIWHYTLFRLLHTEQHLKFIINLESLKGESNEITTSLVALPSDKGQTINLKPCNGFIQQ